jgi:hypothetical protein
LLEGFLNGLKNGWNFVWDFVKNFPQNLLRGFSTIGTWLLDSGGSLLRGLWDGISGAASWLKNKIMDWAGSILPGWVKSILGIKSPSTVFAKLGLYTMQGFAKGMDVGTMSAVKSAIYAAQAVNDAFNTNIGLNDPGFSDYASGYVNGYSGGATSTASADAGNTGPISGPTVPITIYTNEINPLQHAAELGDALVNRVG